MITFSISGFGGSYEWGCQRMLWLGLEWLKQHPEFSFDKAYRQFENVGGLAIAENAQAKELDTAIVDDPRLKKFGVTGAMHQFVINHLAFIHHKGYEKWCEELQACRGKDEVFDFDGEKLRVVGAA